MDYYGMAVTRRHNYLANSLFTSIIDLLRANKLHALQEESNLVHYSCKLKGDILELVDLSGVRDINRFKADIINELEYVQPDFFMFDKNSYIENERQTRTAGCPDLVVEVRSGTDTDIERKLKFALYASSGDTEHWYLEQDSNLVKCYKGYSPLADQYLYDILRTCDGIEFDLRYLAL